MAASSRAGNISPGSDDFAAFQHQAGSYTNGQHDHGTNGNSDEHYQYDEQYDEELDFEPQNGYHDQDLMPTLAELEPEAQGKKGGKVKAMKNPERGRDPIKMPKVDLKSKFASMNQKVKKARMPSPGEIVDGYFKSDFHQRSFKQPLVCKVRVEEVDVQKARQLLTQQKSPTELGNLRHPLDIPLPKLKMSGGAGKSEETEAEVEFDPRVKEGSKLYNTLPRSWRTQNLVTSSREITDVEELSRRKQLIESKSPGQLGNINSITEFPVPSGIKRMVSPSERIIAAQKRAKEKGEDVPQEPFSMYGTLPRSMRETKLVTNVKEMDDPEELEKRRALVDTKSPTQLSQIHGLNDLPVPSNIEKLFKGRDRSSSVAKDTQSENLAPKSFGDSMYATLPKSWKEQNLITKVKEEDPETVAKNKALTTEKTPAQLAQITSLDEFPIPEALENFLKSDKKVSKVDGNAPSKPLPKMTLEGMYETLPRSLKTEVLVKSRVMEDPEELERRKELIEAKKPSELSKINGFNDFPIPTRIESLMSKKGNKSEMATKSMSWSDLGKMDVWREKMPESMKAEVLVKARVEDPEVQRQRAEITKCKTPNQLSQINSLADFPIPTTIETMLEKRPKSSVPMEEAADPKPIKDKLYDTLPRSMKSEVLVRVRDEDPELQKQRQELTRSKSPVELSQISSLAEFPIPKNIEGLLNKKNAIAADAVDNAGPTPPPRRFRREELYDSLPASLKTEVLVKTKIETDEEVLKHRQELTRSKSPAQLSEMKGLDDFPIPTFVENLTKRGKAEDISSSQNLEESGQGTMKKLYNTLPGSLKSEVLVRARQEEPEIQLARAEIIKNKSVNELSQITSIDDFPLPKSVEHLIGRAPRPVERRKKFRKMQRSASAKSMEERMQSAIPESMKTQVLVKARVEDPQLQQSRSQIIQSKSVSELSQISSWSDFPVPTTIEKFMSKSDISYTPSGPPSFDISMSGRSSSIPKNKKELKDIVYNKCLPESLKRPVVVRCKTEDPALLRKRQNLQQSKSIHELSKIRNLNEFPLPVNLRLPDLPLPKVRDIIGVIARVPKKNKKTPVVDHEDQSGYSLASTPALHDRTYTDDEMLRYEMSSPESMAPREQDFDYEVIEASNSNFEFMQTEIPDDQEESSISVADHYKGTPPLKTKKKPGGKNRYSGSDYQVKSGDEIPPPLPPKGIRNHGPSDFFDQLEPRELTDKDYLSGSNEMLFIPGEPTELQLYHAPGPKIAYSYQHDPKVTPMRKISTNSSGAEETATETLPQRPLRGRSSKDGTPVQGRTSQQSMNKLTKSASGTSANTMTSLADQWHSVRSTAGSRTEDETLMHSCADTLVGDDDLHSLTDTLNDPRDLGSDDEFFSEMLPRDMNRQQ